MREAAGRLGGTGRALSEPCKMTSNRPEIDSMRVTLESGDIRFSINVLLSTDQVHAEQCDGCESIWRCCGEHALIQVWE